MYALAIPMPIFQVQQIQHVNITTLANTVKDSESCRAYLQFFTIDRFHKLNHYPVMFTQTCQLTINLMTDRFQWKRTSWHFVCLL